jgi:lipid-binding SYLF domain-containing protein
MGSIRFGSGLIVARLPDGSWSAPSAMAMGGLGAGGQFGAELTDFVFVLTTDAAVKTFMQSGNLTLGGNISMAVGPIGRSAEAGGVLGTKGATGVFAYSKTRGLYGGLTVEGGVLAERADANKKLYGRKVRAKELLGGLVPPPPEAAVLFEVLNGEFFRADLSAEAAPEVVAESTGETTVAAAQASNEQVQETPAPVADQLPAADRAVAPELSAEQTPGTTQTLVGESHGVADAPNAQEATPVAQNEATAELDTEGASGLAEQPNKETYDAHETHDVAFQEPTPIAEHIPAAESTTQPAPEETSPGGERNPQHISRTGNPGCSHY